MFIVVKFVLKLRSQYCEFQKKGYVRKTVYSQKYVFVQVVLVKKLQNISPGQY